MREQTHSPVRMLHCNLRGIRQLSSHCCDDEQKIFSKAAARSWDLVRFMKTSSARHAVAKDFRQVMKCERGSQLAEGGEDRGGGFHDCTGRGACGFCWLATHRSSRLPQMQRPSARSHGIGIRQQGPGSPFLVVRGMWPRILHVREAAIRGRRAALSIGATDSRPAHCSVFSTELG